MVKRRISGYTKEFFLCLVLLLDMSEPEREGEEREGSGERKQKRERGGRERKVVYFITLAQGAKSREAASAGVVSRCCWRYPAAATYKEL